MVSATQSTATWSTRTTDPAKTYRITWAGSVVNAAGNVWCDARWLSNDSAFTAPYTHPNWGFDIFGARATETHPFNPEHIYEYLRAGTGSTVSFRIADSGYHDNSGVAEIWLEELTD